MKNGITFLACAILILSVRNPVIAQHNPALDCTSLRRAILAMSQPQSTNRGQQVHWRKHRYYTTLPKLWGEGVIMEMDSLNDHTFSLYINLSGREAQYAVLEAQLQACLDAETINWETDGAALQPGFYCDQLHLYIRLMVHSARHGGGMYLLITREPEP